MRKNHSEKFFLFIIALASYSVAFSQKESSSKDLKVVIIRHGEKSNNTDSLSCDSTGVEGDNLSCRGLNRALALPAVLHAKFGVPDYVYVPSLSNGKSTGSSRMFQTVTPFAVKYNLRVNTNYVDTATTKAAKSILKHTGTVLVVWEHGNIPSLVKRLGVTDKVPKWRCTDFDSIWIVTISKKKVKFSKDDREGINPSPVCPQ